MHSAFILTTVIVSDVQNFAEYRAAVALVNEKLGGEMVIRGSVQEVLEGQTPHGEVVVGIGFPSSDAARAYIASDAYAALAPLRQKAGAFTIRVIG